MRWESQEEKHLFSKGVSSFGRDDSTADSPAAQRLSDCWLAALGYRPSGWDDTLQAHRAGYAERIGLTRRVREAFRCYLQLDFFSGDVPFEETARLLEPLAPRSDTGDPTIYLAPGLSGVALSELLIAKDYPGPGRIHPIPYPAFEQNASSRDIVQDHVNAIIHELPPASCKSKLLLAGYSFGAHVVLEVACKLAAAGRPIARVILINSVAFPEREYIPRMCRRLRECRSARDLASVLLWKLTAPNGTVLQSCTQLLHLMKKTSLADHADRLEVALARRGRLRAWFDFQPGRYPGEVCLFRPLRSTSACDDEGWSALSGTVHVSSFPVSSNDFLKRANRQHVVKELSRLAEQHFS
jgi:thioesterase domain-containing protein